MAYRQNLHQLEDKLNQLHPADFAMLLEQLPLPERLIVWGLVRKGYDGEVLLELTDAVRLSLIENMDSAELLAATEQLDTDEIADLVLIFRQMLSLTFLNPYQQKNENISKQPCRTHKVVLEL